MAIGSPTIVCPYCGMESPEGNRYCGDCGAMLVAPELAQRMHPYTGQGSPIRIRVNLLCYAGAIIAVLALFLPWAVIQHDGTDARINLGPYDLDSDEGFTSNFRQSVTLFLIGTILAFFTPIGGIPQLMGSVGFILTASTTTLVGFDMLPWIGPVVGVLASFLVLLSLYEPVGIGYPMGSETDGIGRIFPISPYK